MANEELRLAALQSYEVLGTPPEPEYDRLIRFVADACGVPMALLTLVDGSHARFKAALGVDLRQIERVHSICAVGIARDGPTVIEDASLDPRFCDNPWVVGAPHVRFYACAPLRSPEGFAIGALSILDQAPRKARAQELSALQGFASYAMLLLEQRRQTLQVAAAGRAKALLEEQAALEAESRTGVLAVLQDIARSEAHFSEVLQMVAERLMALIQPAGVQIEMVEGDDLVRYGAAGTSQGGVGERLDKRQGISAAALQTGQVQYSADTEADPAVNHAITRAMGTRSLVVAPLRAHQEVIGLVRLTSKRSGGFSQVDIDRIAVLSDSLGSVIHRRRLTDEMERSRERYRVLFDGNPRPMLVCELEGLRFLAVNVSAARLYGYTIAEFLQLTLLDLWVPEVDTEFPTREAFAASFRRVPLLGKTTPRRRVHRRKDGSHFHVEVTGDGIVFDGKPVRLVHVRDLTEQLRAEQEIARLARAQRMLSACNEALIRAAEESQLLDRICRIAVEIGGYLFAWVGFARDDEAKTVFPAASAGPHGALIRELFISWSEATPAGQNAPGRAIRTGRITVVPEILVDPALPHWRAFSEVVGHRGLIALPLRGARGSFGALSLYAPDTLDMSTQEQALLEELANDLAFGILNLRALDEQRRLQSAVLKVGAAVSTQSGDAFFEHLLTSLMDAVGAQAGHVARLLPGTPPAARTLCATIDGKRVDDFEFFMHDTPCADFPTRDSWHLPEAVLDIYPKSAFLHRVAAKSRVVRRLDSSDGQPIGFIAVVFRESLSDTGFVDAMLRIFAARAASELGRLQSDARIRSQASLLDKAQDAISVRDLKHRIVYWNQGAEAVYGWTADEVMGRSMLDIIQSDPAPFLARTEQVLQDGGWTGELVQRRKDGARINVETRLTLVHDDEGQPTSILAINTDITRRKEAEEAVHKLAYFDPLTALPNRQSFNFALRAARRASANSGHHGALLFINVDNFKAVNETLGHETGDMLLKQVGRRLEELSDGGDTVARLGGDEFLILLEPRHAQREALMQHADTMAQRVVQAFSAPFVLDDFEHLTTACVGVATFQGDEAEDGELLKQADLALYQAKGVGRGVVRFYDPGLQLAVVERATLEADLRQALARHELELYYQPQVHRNGHVIGVEALLRWNHPQRGMVSPANFIPIAEESGLILSIGRWVIDTACTQLARWANQEATAQLTISVNVSASQFRHDDFVDQVVSATRGAGIRPASLKLELTESLLVYDMSAIIEKMQLLKSHGLGLSLDDFGTGYSSLSYLKLMPLDQLKIDQSFVRDVMTNPHDAAIAVAVIDLARRLGLMVVAEGVESAEQRDFLFQNHCDAFQGYLMSRPLPIDRLEVFLGTDLKLARTPSTRLPTN